MARDAGTVADADQPRLVFDPRLLSIVAASAVGVFGNQLVPPILPSIGTGLTLSDTQIGLVMTVFFFASMLSVPVLGAAADIYGRRPVILGSLLAFGTGGVAVLAVGSFPGLLAMRALQGIGIAGTTALSVAFIGDFFEEERGTTAQGIRSAVNGAMIIVAPAVAGAIATLSWRYPFLLYGAAFPVFLVVYRYLPEATDATGEGGPGSADGGAVSIRAEVGRYVRTIADSLQDRNVAVLVLGGFTLFFTRYGLFTIVPLLATRRLGASVAALGLALSLVGIVRVVVSPLSGKFVSVVSRKQAFALTMGVVALSMAMLTVVGDMRGLAAALVVFSVGMALFNTVLNDTITTAADARNRAGVVSSVQTAKGVANTTSPTVFTAVLAFGGFLQVFALASAVALGYVLLVVVALDPEAY
ncbi:MAG: MFS transporter [Haloferacaceae archaeon]